MNNLNNNNFQNKNSQGQFESMDCDEYRIQQIPSQLRNPSDAWIDLNKVMKGGFQIAADATNSIKEKMDQKLNSVDKKVQEQFIYIWKCIEENATRNRAFQENLTKTTDYLYNEIISRTNCYDQIFNQISTRLDDFTKFANNSLISHNNHSTEIAEMSKEIKNIMEMQNETLKKNTEKIQYVYDKTTELGTKVVDIKDSMKSLETMTHLVNNRYNADSETIRNMIKISIEENNKKLREEKKLTKKRDKSNEKSSTSIKKEILPSNFEQSSNGRKTNISSENDKLINKINNNKNNNNNFINEKSTNIPKPESIRNEHEPIKDNMNPMFTTKLFMRGEVSKEPRKFFSSLNKEKDIIVPIINKIDDDDNCFFEEEEEEPSKPLLIPDEIDPFSSIAFKYICRRIKKKKENHETLFFINQEHKQKSIIFLEIEKREIRQDNLDGIIEELEWLLERKYDSDEIQFHIAEGDGEALQLYMESYLETLKTSYKLENYTPQMKKKIKENDYIYQIHIKEDKITFQRYPNNEDKRKMLGTFFLENFKKTFDFVNYTIIAKDIEDKEEAKKRN